MSDTRDLRVTFRIEAGAAEAIAVLAHRRGRSTGAEIRAALAAHLTEALNETRPTARPGDVHDPRMTDASLETAA